MQIGRMLAVGISIAYPRVAPMKTATVRKLMNNWSVAFSSPTMSFAFLLQMTMAAYSSAEHRPQAMPCCFAPSAVSL